MHPAEQVWSDPDMCSLSLLTRGFLVFLVHPTFYSMLLQLCPLTASSTGQNFVIVHSLFLLNPFILASLCLLFAWARGLRSAGSEIRSLLLCHFLYKKEFWTPQTQSRWWEFNLPFLVSCTNHLLCMSWSWRQRQTHTYGLWGVPQLMTYYLKYVINSS